MSVPETAPQAIKNFEDEPDHEEHIEDFRKLLIFLANRFVEVKNNNDDKFLATVIPSYAEGNVPTGLDSSETDRRTIVVEDNELKVI